MAHGLLSPRSMHGPRALDAPALARSAPTRAERRLALGALAAVVALGVLHYVVGGDAHGHAAHGHDAHPAWHALLRRASTIPIGIAAVVGGARVGLLAGALATVIYMPHAFFAAELSALTSLSIHADPSSVTERVSEVVTYLTLGLLLGVLTDRARRERARATHLDVRLQRTEEELARAERLSSLGELVAGVAHEIRNPLTALVTSGELLADMAPEGHAKHRMAKLHMDELHRLGRVVERFLSFARPSDPQRRDVSLGAVFERVVSLLSSTARQNEVEIVAHGTGAHVHVDEDQLVQVLLNLALNAIQASPPGAVVELEAEVDDDGSARMHVRDRGRGVPDELRERVFDPCVTTRPDGSGLGLSIASRIAFAHDGTLSLAPREGGGTVATLALPPRAANEGGPA